MSNTNHLKDSYEYFAKNVLPHIHKSHTVLDIGCGGSKYVKEELDKVGRTLEYSDGE